MRSKKWRGGEKKKERRGEEERDTEPHQDPLTTSCTNNWKKKMPAASER